MTEAVIRIKKKRLKNMSKKDANVEVEQEIKIQLSREDLERVFSKLSAEVKTKDIGHKYLPRQYFDTSDLMLHAKHISLRVQYKPGAKGTLGSYEQTVKFELIPQKALVKGMLLRKECKDAIGSPHPDLSAIADSQAVDIIKPFKNKKLIHIFTAAVERRMFNLEVGKGKKRGTVEVAFDVGNIILAENGKHYPFSEIEIELKKGSDAAITAVQEKIMKLAPSAYIKSYTSKADVGCRIYKKYKARKTSP